MSAGTPVEVRTEVTMGTMPPLAAPAEDSSSGAAIQVAHRCGHRRCSEGSPSTSAAMATHG